MTEHELKCWPEYFNAILEGRKHFEVREGTDRVYFTNDTLWLREWDQTTQDYTGRELKVKVTYVHNGPDDIWVIGLDMKTVQDIDLHKGAKELTENRNHVHDSAPELGGACRICGLHSLERTLLKRLRMAKYAIESGSPTSALHDINIAIEAAEVEMETDVGEVRA